ncbi:hypothetical protein B0H14DRAFT_2562085 [Mycena olivaceomarginata]|nr:hypothetical protein B0H14DRAFT_2562085 [Mycena olivaceomarginata]
MVDTLNVTVLAAAASTFSIIDFQNRAVYDSNKLATLNNLDIANANGTSQNRKPPRRRSRTVGVCPYFVAGRESLAFRPLVGRGCRALPPSVYPTRPYATGSTEVRSRRVDRWRQCSAASADQGPECSEWKYHEPGRF